MPSVTDLPAGADLRRAPATWWAPGTTTDHQRQLVAQLRSHDPLASHVATSLLLQALRQAPPDADPSWVVAHAMSPPPPGPAAVTPDAQRQSLTNALEACRRLLEALCCPERDPELQSEAAVRTSGAVQALVRRTAAQALPDWQAAATDMYAALSEAEVDENERELPLVWVVKLARALKRSYEEEDEEDQEAGAVEAEKRRVVEAQMLTLCQACWIISTKGVECRREILGLALDLLRDVDQEEKQETTVLRALASLCSHEDDNDTADGTVQGSPSSAPSRCSLVRPAQANELWPHRLALWSTLARRVVERGSEDADSSPYLALLMQTPLSRAHFLRGPEGGTKLLVERLADQDDLLVSVLHDLLVVHWGLRMLPPPRTAADKGLSSSLLPAFLLGTDPSALFSCLLERLPNASAEQVFLEFLVSNETCALLYLTRLAKFIAWQQQQQQQGTCNSPHTEAVTAFLLGLGQRVQSMASKNLFPYDAAPLLARLQQLHPQR